MGAKRKTSSSSGAVASKRKVEGIAGGSGGKYPKLVVDVKTITTGVLRPQAGTDLSKESTVVFRLNALPDQMIR